MALLLGGDYKSFFIGGPKNGRVVFVDRYYPQSYQYAEAKMPPSAFYSYADKTLSVTSAGLNIKYINYHPHRFVWQNRKTCQRAEFIVMVYDKARNVSENRTLEALVRSGRISPYLIVNDEDFYKV